MRLPRRYDPRRKQYMHRTKPDITPECDPNTPNITVDQATGKCSCINGYGETNCKYDNGNPVPDGIRYKNCRRVEISFTASKCQ